MDKRAIKLLLTCSACPEQYDAYLDGVLVGYLRMRHGNFTVDCPDVSGELVYEAQPEGDGAFESGEREHFLDCARIAICNWLQKRQDIQDTATDDNIKDAAKYHAAITGENHG